MKNIVISGVNIDSGGTLSIYVECLQALEGCPYYVTALVHDKSLFVGVKNINFIEIPKAKRNYLYRVFYEYIYFYFISLRLKPDLWFSLHDMTPNVKARLRAVYCHNPAPFYKMSTLEKKLDKKMWLFSLFYKYLYKINLKKNNFVILQQNWIAEKFVYEYSTNPERIIIAKPDIKIDAIEYNQIVSNRNTKQFFYPAFPRSFKNFEVICEAANYLLNNGYKDFEIILTISGDENDYAKYIYGKYSDNQKIKFIGRISREEVFSYYHTSDCLIFPSKIETFGLPILEYQYFSKPILAANFPYAIEAIDEYKNVKYFNPNSYDELARFMVLIITNNAINTIPNKEPSCYNKVRSWLELFEKIFSCDEMI